MGNYSPQFIPPKTNTNTVTTLMTSNIGTNIYSRSIQTFFYGRSGNYIFSYEKPISYPYLTLYRNNITQSNTISDSVVIMALATSPDFVEYIAISDTEGLLIVQNYPTLVINFYDINWNMLSATFRTYFDYSVYPSNYYLRSTMGTTVENGNLRIVLGIEKVDTGLYSADFLIYNYTGNTFIFSLGPNNVGDNYRIIDAIPIYADIGDGKMGMFLQSSNIRKPSYLSILDTIAGTGVYTPLPFVVNTPIQVGDYLYSESNNTSLAPKYDDNSIYAQISYGEVLSGTDFTDWTRIVSMDILGNITVLNTFGSGYTTRSFPENLMYSKDSVLSLRLDRGTTYDDYVFFDVLGNIELFRKPIADSIATSAELDDIDDEIIYTKDTDDRNYSTNLISASSVFTEENDTLVYTDAWSWSGWDVISPVVDWSSMTYVATYTGIHVQAKATKRDYAPVGSPIWTGSDDSTLDGGVQITPLTQNNLYMVTATGKFNQNKTLVPPFYSTYSTLYFGGVRMISDISGWGGTSYGDIYTTSTAGSFVYGDNAGTPVDTIISPRMFFTAGSIAINVGNADYPPFRGDNEGLISYAAYNATYTTLELGVSVPITGTSYFNTEILIEEVHKATSQGRFFLRVVYTDGTYREQTTPYLSNFSTGVFNYRIRTLLADEGKTFEKITFGRYLDTINIPPEVDMEFVVTELRIQLSNSMAVEKTSWTGVETLIKYTGNLGGSSNWVRVIGNIIDYLTVDYLSTHFIIPVSAGLRRFQAIFWN